MQKKIKVVIADDHSVVRQGIALIIEGRGDMELVAGFSSGFELIEKIGSTECDVLILDINMPGDFIIDNINKLKEIRPEMPILIFSVNPEKNFAERVFSAGVAGYLNKKCDSAELLEAIRKVASGGRFISREFSEELIYIMHKKCGPGDLKSLSDREFEILILLASGKSVSDIADEQFLSKNTVSNHRKNILKKLNLKNTSELILYAVKNRLIE